jgi:hypothetical protein
MKRGLLAFAMVTMTACGGDSTGTGTGGACTAKDGFCATLEVPPSYAGKPVKVIVGLYKKLDAAGPAGPPDAVALQEMNPTISPTMPLVLEPGQLGVQGDYFVYAALYDEGGGTFQPVKGVDYTAQTATAITLGGGTSPDLGVLQLALAR